VAGIVPLVIVAIKLEAGKVARRRFEQ